MSRYQMREKLFAIGDDYWIEDETGEKVLKVNGKAMRVRETLIFEDRGGNELLKIQERKLRLHGTMVLERDGDTVATVRKALITPEELAALPAPVSPSPWLLVDPLAQTPIETLVRLPLVDAEIGPLVSQHEVTTSSGITLARSSAAMVSANSATHGTLSSSRFQNSPIVPPGRSTRRISASAAGGSNQWYA